MGRWLKVENGNRGSYWREQQQQQQRSLGSSHDGAFHFLPPPDGYSNAGYGVRMKLEKATK